MAIKYYSRFTSTLVKSFNETKSRHSRISLGMLEKQTSSLTQLTNERVGPPLLHTRIQLKYSSQTRLLGHVRLVKGTN
jgi:hypothetical protein